MTAILALQALFISCYLPFAEWFSPSLVYTDDFPLHYGDMLDKKFFLNTYASTWGYNPFERAGTVSNVIVGIDNNAWALWAFLLPFLPEPVALKTYFIFLGLIIPLLLYRAARNFDFGRAEAAVFIGMGTLLVHTTICVDFIYWGSISYVSSVFLSLYIASLAFRFLRYGSAACLITQTLVLGAALWIHIFTVINCLPLVFLVMLALLRRTPLRRTGLEILGLLAAALLSLPWLIPFLKLLDTSQGNSFAHYTTTDIFEWANTYLLGKPLFNTFAVPFKKTVFIDIGLMLLGVAGLAGWRKNRGALAIAFGGAIAFLFLFAYFGSFIPFTRTLTPLRFTIMMNACLALPASVVLCSIYRRLASASPARGRIALVAGAVVIALLVARPYRYLFIGQDFRFLTALPPEIEQLVSHIKKATTPEARILVENSDFESNHVYARGHFPRILPHLTGREYIGSDCAYNPTRDSKVSFLCGSLFQRRIETLGLEEVAMRCELYNIAWVICWSAEAKNFFGNHPGYFIPDGAIGQFFLYRVNRKPNFFLKGGGTVRAEMNRIELRDLVPQDGEIIISYHWMKFLKTEPPVTMERAFLQDDPVGFIRLKNPPPGVVIYNGY